MKKVEAKKKKSNVNYYATVEFDVDEQLKSLEDDLKQNKISLFMVGFENFLSMLNKKKVISVSEMNGLAKEIRDIGDLPSKQYMDKKIVKQTSKKLLSKFDEIKQKYYRFWILGNYSEKVKR
jgi:hypothetical protein